MAADNHEPDTHVVLSSTGFFGRGFNSPRLHHFCRRFNSTEALNLFVRGPPSWCRLSEAIFHAGIEYTGDKEQPNEDVPFQSVDEILKRERGGDLFRYLLEKFASFSGISGVQPKILVRDERAFTGMEHTGHRLSSSYRGQRIS